jgi:formate dehydrogenase maturation protein FdhE
MVALVPARREAVRVHQGAEVTYAIISIVGLFLLLLASTGVWLHAEVSEGKRLRDTLDSQRELAGKYQHERDVEVAAHAVTKDQYATEKTLRAIAETQRNEAQRKLRAYLARNLATASEQEITDVINDVFATPLSLVPGSELERP